MKVLKRLLMPVILAVTLTAACPAPLFGLKEKAKAWDDTNYDTAYYFSDTTETAVDMESLSDVYSSYWRMVTDSYSMNRLIKPEYDTCFQTYYYPELFKEENYNIVEINGFPPAYEMPADQNMNCTIIFDLRYTVPDSLDLCNGFETLNRLGCRIFLIGCFAENDFENTQFMDFVDRLYTIYPYDDFMEYIFDDISTFDNSTIFLDERLGYYGENPSFQKIFSSNWVLQSIVRYAGDFTQPFETLREHNIRILLQLNDEEFVDLSNSDYATNVIPIPDKEAGVDKFYEHFNDTPNFAIGFGPLTQNMYDFLFEIQENVTCPELQIYIFPIDEINFGPGGLEVNIFKRDFYQYWYQKGETNAIIKEMLMHLR